MLPKIGNNKSLSQQAYDAIKKAILTNEFKPKDILREEALADSLGISRTPLRAALKRLQYEKLVVVNSAKQTFVSEVKTEDMARVFVFRFAVEPMAARVAAALIGKKGLGRIEECLASHAACVKERNVEKAIVLELLFNTLLAECTENEFLIDGTEMINTYVQRFLSVANSTVRNVPLSLEEHGRIFEALKAHDAKAAEAQTNEHLSRVVARFGFTLPF
ncbi:putative GntR family transcriptional regulator [uncultured delta proteobacterium]|uniref:Putative GntR family transcriptional regulator n=1 Tax=uncultured delta proteobacterium TaxID=34034 RepID=A0A212K4L3_9DELT|nr:putative GntR family transcriptional regulator [uncultured delta proteobacterium]